MKPLKDVSIVCGKPLKLDVVVQGVPQPGVRWYKEDKLLDASEFIIDSKDKTHSLSIKETTAEHSGIYKIVVENSAGIMESISNVEIQTKPQISQPSDIKIISGEEFQVVLGIEGKPSPKVKWQKDKKEIPSTLGLTASEQGSNYSLYLKESTTLLNGSFTITATNAAGTDSASFKVVVSGIL